MALRVSRENPRSTHGGWENADVVFLADDLGAWLVGQLADAGRKKLTTLVLGSDQERALRQAATAAVQDTAIEMSSSGREQAEHLAMVISEVFREPLADARLARRVTLLEGLQAGISRQLAVLDDADLTAVGQSSADVLGVPGTVLAERLTGHLVREILLRGSRGGTLTPLADQLNHDLTHLQGQRVEGMLARLAGEVRDVAVNGEVAVGRPLGEVTDPFALEVHRPVQPDGPQHDLPVLPVYVPREHDDELKRVVEGAAEGHSGMAVLVGGSSTGKTRACWEALRLLRDQEPGWRLWHPIDPSRPEAALRDLRGIRPRTVVWLNEAQFYLDVPGGLGERVAAGLRELLRDPARGPVLVLATMWPAFWAVLATRPQGGADSNAQARELLAGCDIPVPAAFTGPQLQRLGEAGDVRLAQAAAGAQGGRVIQFLAGTPELLARYRNAPPAARALIHAAMDARRLGMRRALPRAFLEAGAPGYLTDSEWDQLADDWLEQALAYAVVLCRGVRGPLARVRPRPPSTAGSSDHSTGPAYQLADYLDQQGRVTRRDQIPPAAFWAAAASYAHPGDLDVLGNAAHDRGLYRAAAQLDKHATALGDTFAAYRFVDNLHRLHPTDKRPARWAATHVAVNDPLPAAFLLRALRDAGAGEQVTAFADRAAAHADLGDPDAVASLLRALRDAGAHEQATAFADRAAAQADLDNPVAVASLLRVLQEAGAGEQAAALLARDPAAHADLGDSEAVASLLGELREAGAQEQAALLAERAAAHADLGDPYAVASLLGGLREAGAQEQAAVLAVRAAAHADLGNPYMVASLIRELREAGADQQVTALLARDPAAHADLGDPDAVAYLLRALRRHWARGQVTVLAERAAAHADLGHPHSVASLLHALREAGAQEQAALLAERAAAHADLGDPYAVASLLRTLRDAGAHEQATAFADRAAAQADLDNPVAVASLLRVLQEAGAQEQVALLAERAAAHADLGDPYAVASLLRALRDAGAQERAAVLAVRAAAHADLRNPVAVASLIRELREAGTDQPVTALLARDPAAHAELADPSSVASLLRALREAGAQEQVVALAERAATHADLGDPLSVASLLRALREAGAQEQVVALAERAAAYADLDHPYAVASLLRELRAAGTGQQAAVLADRAAAHAELDDPAAVESLLRELREAGAQEQQAEVLIDRLPGAGMLRVFLRQEGREERFRFGREADGSPAEQWGWEALD